jgi:hypothetical protein
MRGESRIPIDGDLTGDGAPNLLAAAHSGGTHCCWEYHIYSLGNDFRKINVLVTQDAEVRFVNLDHDPAFEAETYDFVFAYSYTSFGASPVPRIVFKFKDGKYRIAPDLMRQPSPPEAELRREAMNLRTDGDWNRSPNQPYDPKLWKIMLDLIYTGHYARADRFLNEAWPSSRNDKRRFRHEFFECQLRRSHNWTAIAAMNHVPADAPLSSCPEYG